MAYTEIVRCVRQRTSFLFYMYVHVQQSKKKSAGLSHNENFFQCFFDHCYIDNTLLLRCYTKLRQRIFPSLSRLYNGHQLHINDK